MTYSRHSLKNWIAGGLLVLRRSLHKHVFRATALIGAYLCTTGIFLACLYIVKAKLAQPLFGNFLSVTFVMTLAAGLEPATAKARLIKIHELDTARISEIALLAASALKGVAASFIVGAIWVVSKRPPGFEIVFALPITILGFWATDLRVLLDRNGSYVAAIWVKQGSLSIGYIILTAGLMMNASFPVSLVCSLSARLGWIITFFYLNGAIRRRGSVFSAEDAKREVRAFLLRDPWIYFAALSVLAALGGSVDRVIALRLLAQSNSSNYISTYEILTKFWLLPYLISPIIFARSLRGKRSSDTSRAIKIVGFLGGCFIITHLVVMIVLPSVARKFFGPGVDYLSLSFTLAIVLSAMAQIYGAEAQARGLANHLAFISGFVLISTSITFYFLVSTLSIDGLYIGWLIKSALDLGLVAWLLWSKRQVEY